MNVIIIISEGIKVINLSDAGISLILSESIIVAGRAGKRIECRKIAGATAGGALSE